MTKSSLIGAFLMDFIEGAPERQNIAAIPLEYLTIRTEASVGEVLVPMASKATQKLALQMVAMVDAVIKRREELKKADSYQAIQAFELEENELSSPAIAAVKQLFQLQMRLDLREVGVDSRKYQVLALGENLEIIGYTNMLNVTIDVSLSETERRKRATAE